MNLNLPYYNYPIKNMLDDNTNSICNVDNYHNIYLCIYQINTKGKLPFIQYLLSNNESNNYNFILLKRHSSLHSANIIDCSVLYLSGIFHNTYFEELKYNLSFQGFYQCNQNLYLFFDATKCLIQFDETHFSDMKRWALMDEIINLQKICNIPISNVVHNFFISLDPYYLFLYNNKNQVYEMPIIGYVGKPTPEKIVFCKTFGENIKNKKAILGPYYYFTNFENAIRQGGWSSDYKPHYANGQLVTDTYYGIYNNGGIIRFALFMGSTKIIENSPNDICDESFIKQEKMNDSKENNRYQILTLRISDHDGNWAQQYDSVHLADIELDDGSYLQESVPMFVVKEYNQQLPLSYHFIDKTHLGKCFDKHYTKYKIL